MKLGLGALMSMAAAGLLSLMVSWWSSQLDQVNANPYDSLRFGARDIVPIGYAVFAFALGVTAGLLFRRLLPAMLTALIGFAAVREIVTSWVRPNLIAPFHESLPITAATPVSVDRFPDRYPGLREHQRGRSFERVGLLGQDRRQRRPCPHVLVPQPSVSPGQLRSAESPGLHRQARRQVPPGGHLSAGQSLLAHAVGRTGDRPRPRHRPGRLLLLVDTPAVRKPGPGPIRLASQNRKIPDQYR